ncbi:MAG TPA: hypothetical protein DIU39_05025, partial [Flavobacteriales bacterium]|nr:hypothetical protein [Flavobacteriales bacterium]
KIDNINIIVQFSEKTYSETEKYKNEIIELSKTNKNIKIVYGYSDYYDSRKLLKEMDIKNPSICRNYQALGQKNLINDDILFYFA